MNGLGSKKKPLGNSNVANIESTQASSMAQSSSMIGSKADTKPSQVKDKFSDQKPSFVSGGKLPSLDDGDEGQFPGLAEKNPELANKAKQMFDDLDFDDDDDEFDQSGAKKNKAANLEFEEEGDSDDDFNANELLNFSDYQNKRRQKAENQNPPPAKKVTSPFGQKKPTVIAAPNQSIKDVFDDKKRE